MSLAPATVPASEESLEPDEPVPVDVDGDEGDEGDEGEPGVDGAPVGDGIPPDGDCGPLGLEVGGCGIDWLLEELLGL